MQPSAVPPSEPSGSELSTPASAVPERILIYGVTGSGKSTLCRDIGKATGLPWHWVDELIWEPGWIQPSAEVQRERIAGVCRKRQWILDSAYGSWIDIPLNSVQLIICLDYPRWVSLARLVRRTFSRTVRRSVVCNGNVETLRRTFSRESILVWHFKSFSRKRSRIRAWAAGQQAQTGGAAANGVDLPPFQVIVFRSPRQTRNWLARIKA